MSSIISKVVAIVAASVLSVSTAMAAGPAATHSGSPYASILMLVGFVVIFYFLLWRPQSKRAKAHKALIAGLTVGDEVVTNGGIVGKIARVEEGFMRLSIAEGVEIKVQKGAVSANLPKGSLK